MNIEPQIRQDSVEHQQVEEQPANGMEQQQPVNGMDEEPADHAAKENEEKMIEQSQNSGEQVRIGDETIFTLPSDLQEQQNNLMHRQRKTRWGQRQIKRSKIQEDAVFNPLEALYSGNSLLPITQYGQSEIEVKLSLYSDGRRKKSKWHHEIQKTFTPPMMNYISPNISLDEVEYLLRLYRLDQLTAKINDFTPEDSDIRSPSPEPIYDKDGRRLNTRQIRKRDSLHRQRICLIEDCMKMRKTFVPPDDYKPLKKYKKIYLTETAANDSKANYIGRIIGPEGKTQKLIERRTKCKIAIRGKGANKKQKNIFENFEPLHIIIVADNDEDLDRGVKEVHNLLNGEEDDEIEELIKQYRQVAVGLLDDNYCDNCKQEGHRTWACPFYDITKNSKIGVRCEICGQTSHPTSDCPQKQAYLKRQQTEQINMLIQSQYTQFRSDIEEKKPKGGVSFITDDVKDRLMIGNSQNPNASAASKSKPAPALVKPKNSNPEELIINNDMPKFEDDD